MIRQCIYASESPQKRVELLFFLEFSLSRYASGMSAPAPFGVRHFVTPLRACQCGTNANFCCQIATPDRFRQVRLALEALHYYTFGPCAALTATTDHHPFANDIFKFGIPLVALWLIRPCLRKPDLYFFSAPTGPAHEKNNSPHVWRIAGGKRPASRRTCRAAAGHRAIGPRLRWLPWD